MDWYDFVSHFPEPHAITVAAYAGAGARGEVYAEPVEVELCIVDHKRRRIRITTGDAAGKEVVSSTTVYAPPGITCPVGSLVTLPDGTIARVLDRADRDAAGLPLPDHVELILE